MFSQRFNSELRALSRLATPMVATSLAVMGMESVDTLMMSYISPETVAAGALAIAGADALFLMCIGFFSALSVLISRAHGAGRHREVGSILRHALWLIVPISILFYLYFISVPVWLAWLGQDVTVLQSTKQYLYGLMIGIPAFLGYFSLREMINAIGRPWVITIICILALPLNGVLDYLLIFGVGPIPSMGIFGIGLGTSLVYILMFLAVLFYVIVMDRVWFYECLNRFEWPSWPIIAELLRVGIPSGILLELEGGMFVTVTILMGLVGTTSLAAHQMVFQWVMFCFMLPLGISRATTIRVGHCIGAEQPLSARYAANLGLGLVMLSATIAAGFFLFAPHLLLSIFFDVNDPANAQLVKYGTTFFMVAGIMVWVDASQVLFSSALRGLKDVMVPMLIATVSYWGVGVLLGYLLAFHTTLAGTGLWIGLAAGVGAACLLLGARFYLKFRALVAAS